MALATNEQESNSTYRIAEDLKRVDVVATKHIPAGQLIKVYGEEGYDLYSDVHATPESSDAEVDDDEDNKHMVDQNVHRYRSSINQTPVLALFEKSVKPGTELYTYNESIIKGQKAKEMWMENFPSEVVYCRKDDQDFVAFPKVISSAITRVYDETKANCFFKILDSWDVVVVASKTIRTDDKLNVYSGPTPNHILLENGTWQEYKRTISKNFYASYDLAVCFDRYDYDSETDEPIEDSGGCKDQICLEHKKCSCEAKAVVCVTGLCKCMTETCKNRPTEKPFPKTYAMQSAIHDIGYFAGEDIPEMTWISEYVGEVISREELDFRSKFYFQTGMNYIADEGSIIIDATRMGNDIRYSNHSCAPNAEVINLLDSEGIDRLFMRSLRLIKKDEEITWDYNEVVDKSSEILVCKCQASTCRSKMNRLKTEDEKKRTRETDSQIAQKKFQSELKEEVRDLLTKTKERLLRLPQDPNYVVDLDKVLPLFNKKKLSLTSHLKKFRVQTILREITKYRTKKQLLEYIDEHLEKNKAFAQYTVDTEGIGYTETYGTIHTPSYIENNLFSMTSAISVKSDKEGVVEGLETKETSHPPPEIILDLTKQPAREVNIPKHTHSAGQSEKPKQSLNQQKSAQLAGMIQKNLKLQTDRPKVLTKQTKLNRRELEIIKNQYSKNKTVAAETALSFSKASTTNNFFKSTLPSDVKPNILSDTLIRKKEKFKEATPLPITNIVKKKKEEEKPKALPSSMVRKQPKEAKDEETIVPSPPMPPSDVTIEQFAAALELTRRVPTTKAVSILESEVPNELLEDAIDLEEERETTELMGDLESIGLDFNVEDEFKTSEPLLNQVLDLPQLTDEEEDMDKFLSLFGDTDAINKDVPFEEQSGVGEKQHEKALKKKLKNKKKKKSSKNPETKIPVELPLKQASHLKETVFKIPDTPSPAPKLSPTSPLELDNKVSLITQKPLPITTPEKPSETASLLHLAPMMDEENIKRLHEDTDLISGEIEDYLSKESEHFMSKKRKTL